MAAVCYSVIHLCRVRVTRLDQLGAHATGPNNVYVSDKPISLGVTPVTIAGEEIDMIGGCDCPVATYRGPDKLKRFDLELSVANLEPEMLEMMLGGSIIVQGGRGSGMWFPSQIACSDAPQPNVAFEGWSDAWDGDHQAAAPFQYVRWLFPSTRWQLGDLTLGNEFANPSLAGFSRTNPLWGLGIYGDQPEAAQGPGGFWFDDAMPAAFCGYQTEGLT